MRAVAGEEHLLAGGVEVGDEIVRARRPRTRRPAARRRERAGSARGTPRRGGRRGSRRRAGRVPQRVRDEVEARDRDHRDPQRLRHHLGRRDADAQAGEHAGPDARPRSRTAGQLDVGCAAAGARSPARAARRGGGRRPSRTSPSTRAVGADRHADLRRSRCRSRGAARTSRRRDATASAAAARSRATTGPVTVDLERAAVVVGSSPGAQAHDEAVDGQHARDHVAPLDERHAVVVDDLLEARGRAAPATWSRRYTSTCTSRIRPVVLAHDRERRAHDRLGDAEARGRCPARTSVLPAPRSPASTTTSPARAARRSRPPSASRRSSRRAFVAVIACACDERVRELASARFTRTKSARVCASAVPPPRSTADGCSVGTSTAAPPRNGNSLPAQLRDAVLGVEQELRGEVAERHDDRRVDELELPVELRAARLDLVRQRIAVARRPALHDVGDVDVVARAARCPR